MKKKLVYISVLSALTAHMNTEAADFINGSFDLGNTSGWITGGGIWYGSPTAPNLNPDDYLSGGTRYNNSIAPQITIVDGSTVDPYLGSLSPVYSAGGSAVRINDPVNDQSISVISQSVTNYTYSKIYFAWLAVLEGSHGVDDSDNFTIRVTDNTSNTVVANRSYSSATAGGTFIDVGGNIFNSGWVAESFDVTLGNDFTISVLAADCPYGGHWGYVYLDSFGPTELFQSPTPQTMTL